MLEKIFLVKNIHDKNYDTINLCDTIFAFLATFNRNREIDRE